MVAPFIKKILNHEIESVLQLMIDDLTSLSIYNNSLFQAMIERYVHWNEDIGEWQLKCVAYTGNNMKKQQALTASVNGTEVSAPKQLFYPCFHFKAI